ncbi:MAG: phytanoyl-CoA dioxygenase family protein [Candidatus Hydrogenedentes bacterium]|nr:phytanoyl-CoA dioxygenase family protein [Candidatus Hydrogenedentota bacterium]
MTVLSPEAAMAKRKQLVGDGFCIVPGVLHGSLLERWVAYSDAVLDRVPLNPDTKYQGSDFHVNSRRRYERDDLHRPDQGLWSPLVDELVDLSAAREAYRLLGFEGAEADDTVLILSKPAHGPALYWHQDFMEWDHPKAGLPWPTRVFLSYYLVDTTVENGCLRAIPGSHRCRLPLHDILPPAHGPEIQALETSHPVFADHPEAIDLPVKAGDLVINDARLLHAAHANTTDHRRTLLLQWHGVFPWPSVPSWWEGAIPECIERAEEFGEYPMTRVPGKYLGAEGRVS